MNGIRVNLSILGKCTFDTDNEAIDAISCDD